jgi:hypothetical protein
MHRMAVSLCVRGASDRSMSWTYGEIPFVLSMKELFTRGSKFAQSKAGGWPSRKSVSFIYIHLAPQTVLGIRGQTERSPRYLEELPGIWQTSRLSPSFPRVSRRAGSG